MSDLMGRIGLSYLAGLLSILSPCVLPLLPVVIAGAFRQHRFGPLALAAGLAVSFTAFGLLIAALGWHAGIDPDAIRFLAASMLLLFGITLLIPALERMQSAAASHLVSGLNSTLTKLTGTGITGQLLVGGLLGAVWSPCAGPALGSAIGLAAQKDSLGQAALIMAAYSIGATTPVVGLAYGARQILINRRNVARAVEIGKGLLGATLICVGVLTQTGLDRGVETLLAKAMPPWMIDLTTSF